MSFTVYGIIPTFYLLNADFLKHPGGKTNNKPGVIIQNRILLKPAANLGEHGLTSHDQKVVKSQAL